MTGSCKPALGGTIALLLCATIWLQGPPAYTQPPSSPTGEYLLNPVILSPSLFNPTDAVNLFYTFRSDFSGFEGAPTRHLADLSGSLNKRRTMTLQGQLQYLHTLLFSDLYLSLGYAIRIRIADQGSLTLGISGVLTHAGLSTADANVNDPNDPLLVGQPDLRQTSLNAGAGLTVRIHGFTGCIASPLLFANRPSGSTQGETPNLALRQSFLLYLANRFPIGEAGGFITPSVLVRTTSAEPVIADIALMGGISGKYWGGMLYRTNNRLGFLAGVGIINRLMIQYLFECYTGSAPQGTGSSHEITLGFRISDPQAVTPKLKDYLK